MYFLNKIRRRKLITLKLSKPQNNYCGVLDGNRKGGKPVSPGILPTLFFLPFISLTLEPGPCHQCRQLPNSAILAQRHPRSVQGPQTPEHHHRSWCECPFQMWVTLTPLPRQQPALQTASFHYFKEKISGRKEGLPDVQFPHSQKLHNQPLFCGRAFAHGTPVMIQVWFFTEITQEFHVMALTDTRSPQVCKGMNQGRFNRFCGRIIYL